VVCAPSCASRERFEFRRCAVLVLQHTTVTCFLCTSKDERRSYTERARARVAESVQWHNGTTNERTVRYSSNTVLIRRLNVFSNNSDLGGRSPNARVVNCVLLKIVVWYEIRDKPCKKNTRLDLRARRVLATCVGRAIISRLINSERRPGKTNRIYNNRFTITTISHKKSV